MSTKLRLSASADPLPIVRTWKGRDDRTSGCAWAHGRAEIRRGPGVACGRSRTARGASVVACGVRPLRVVSGRMSRCGLWADDPRSASRPMPIRRVEAPPLARANAGVAVDSERAAADPRNGAATCECGHATERIAVRGSRGLPRREPFPGVIRTLTRVVSNDEKKQHRSDASFHRGAEDAVKRVVTAIRSAQVAESIRGSRATGSSIGVLTKPCGL